MQVAANRITAEVIWKYRASLAQYSKLLLTLGHEFVDIYWWRIFYWFICHGGVRLQAHF